MREQARLEVAGPLTDEHPCAGIGELCRVLPCILKGFPGCFEQQALLRIEDVGFARRDPEKGRVEFINTLEIASPLHHHFPWNSGVGIKKRGDIHAIRGYLADGVLALAQKCPKRRDVNDAAGKTATDADKGDVAADRLDELQPSCRHALASTSAMIGPMMRAISPTTAFRCASR